MTPASASDPASHTPPAPRPPDAPPKRRLGETLRRGVLQRLGGLHDGELEILDATGPQQFGRASKTDSLEARLRVLNPAFYDRVAFGGTIGAAESFMDGEWETEDLVSLVRLLVRNRDVLVGLEGGLARFAMPLFKLHHRLRSNTRRGSRRNIAAHYDLGNDFYRLFLDDTWMYSCAIFEHNDKNLHAASLAKNERICRKLDLRPRDRVLDIGGGWGGFALYAAKHFGCDVTMTTISQNQYELAVERVREAGLEDRIHVITKDYRDLTGRFDKVVSIEMIEAVGHRFLDKFLRCVSERLEPDGLALIQAITVPDQHYDEVRRGADFIKRYVFPGSCLPSLERILTTARRATDLRLFHLEDLTPHYATTLRRWRERFLENREQVRELGYPEEFLRLWEFYLAYCEGGFSERFTGLTQLLFVKPRCVRDPIAPPAATLGADGDR